MTRRNFVLAPCFWPLRRNRVTLAGIPFETHGNGRSPRRYLLIHGDEETARQVLRAHSRLTAGKAFLVRGGTRHVAAGDGRIDPNRLFSRAGAERSLRRLNPAWPEPAFERELQRLDRERPRLLRTLVPPAGCLLVALHNNGKGYSVHTEVPISNAASLADPGHPHDFFLAVHPKDYELLAAGPYNAVLQQNATGPDDGSLSRLMAAQGGRYVNLEVELGKAERQKEMLEWLERVLP